MNINRVFLKINNFINGKPDRDEWFSKIYEAHYREIYLFLYKKLGEKDILDICQEVFVKVYNSYENIDKEKKIRPFIYKVAKNTFVDYLRKNKINYNDNLDISEFPDKKTYQDEENLRVEKIMSMLEYEKKDILYMKYYLDMSYSEISECLDIPEKTVKSRLYEARGIFRKKWEEADEL